MDWTTKVPRFPLCRVASNPTARATLNYSIFYEFAKSPYAMLALEVQINFPLQHKSLLSSLGVVDPSDCRLITFNLDQGEPQMPSYIAFQVLVSIQNLGIQ